MILRVGLTGGIASGKSTVLSHFAALGCAVLDADRLVSELYQPEREGHRALVASYGPTILLPDGQVDRKQLSAIAFSSPEEAQRLNRLIHPIVIREQQQLAVRLEQEPGDRIFIVEATLLLESGGRDRYERIVVVDVKPEVQLARAVSRGMQLEEARRRIAHQMDRDARLAQADYVIDNSGGPVECEAETRRVHEQLLGDLAMKKRPRG